MKNLLHCGYRQGEFFMGIDDGKSENLPESE